MSEVIIEVDIYEVDTKPLAYSAFKLFSMACHTLVLDINSGVCGGRRWGRGGGEERGGVGDSNAHTALAQTHPAQLSQTILTTYERDSATLAGTSTRRSSFPVSLEKTSWKIAE